jgi:hypothetical protein
MANGNIEQGVQHLSGGVPRQNPVVTLQQQLAGKPTTGVAPGPGITPETMTDLTSSLVNTTANVAQIAEVSAETGAKLAKTLGPIIMAASAAAAPAAAAAAPLAITTAAPPTGVPLI